MQQVDFNAELIKELHNAATIEFQKLCQILTAEINQYKSAWHYRYRLRVWQRDNARPKHPRLIDVEQLETILTNATLSSTLLQSLQVYLNNSSNFRFAKLSPLRTNLNQTIKSYRYSHNINLIDKHLQLVQNKVQADAKQDPGSELPSEDTERVESISVNELDERVELQARQLEDLSNERDNLRRLLREAKDEISKLGSVQAQVQHYQQELATTQGHISQLKKELVSKEELLNIANSSIEKSITEQAEKAERLQQQSLLNQTLETSFQAEQKSFSENLAKLQHLEELRAKLAQENQELIEAINALRAKFDQTTQILADTKLQLADQIQVSAETEKAREAVRAQLSQSVNKLEEENSQLLEQLKTKDATIAQQSQYLQDQRDYNLYLHKAFANYRKSAAELIDAFTQVLSGVIKLFKQVLQPKLGKKLRIDIRNQLDSKEGKYADLLLKQVDQEKAISVETSYKKYIVEDEVMRQTLEDGLEPGGSRVEHAAESSSTPSTPKKVIRSSDDNVSLTDHPSSVVAKIGSPVKSGLSTQDNRARLQRGQKLNAAYIGKSTLSESAVDTIYQSKFSALMNHH